MSATGRESIAPGCVLIETLHAGSTFYEWGRILGEDPGGMHIELIPVTVLRDAEPDTASDPFGRERVRFWCRDDLTGREGWCLFGPRGVVRTEPMPPYFQLPSGTAEANRWQVRTKLRERQPALAAALEAAVSVA